MAHNKTVALSAADKGRATKARNMLAHVQYGDMVAVNYVKRDGTPTVLEGNLVNLIGKDDKEAVVLRTVKGERSANLWRIKSVMLMA